MRAGYASIGSGTTSRRVHFRHAGCGPALLMLHASPMSSRFMVPQIRAVCGRVTAIAPDTPGYGRSDPLDDDAEGLVPYVSALDRFRQALGLDRVGLYGTATGAQIAIEYAKAHAAHVDYLIVDNAADFRDSERDQITAGYFPDLAVDRLGGHLARTWSVARDQLLFFPWHQATRHRRLAAGLEPVMLDAFARELLQAGPDYARAYRGAFANERVARLQAVGVPTTILRWAGSILKPWTDRFDEHDWPDRFRMAPAGAAPAERMAALDRAVARHLEPLEPRDAPPPPRAAAGRAYLDTPDGQIHLAESGSGPPLILLHESGGSSDTASGIRRALAARYRCLTPDLPGHGECALDAGQFEAAVWQMLDRLLELAPGAALGAIGDSAHLAVRHARARRLAQPLVLVDPVDGTALSGGTADPREIPDLAPRLSGGHWLEGWSMLRLRQLFYPWFATDAASALDAQPRLDGESLTAQLRALLASAASYGAARSAALAHTLADDDGGLPHADWYLSGDSPAAALARRSLPRIESWRSLS